MSKKFEEKDEGEKTGEEGAGENSSGGEGIQKPDVAKKLNFILKPDTSSQQLSDFIQALLRDENLRNAFFRSLQTGEVPAATLKKIVSQLASLAQGHTLSRAHVILSGIFHHVNANTYGTEFTEQMKKTVGSKTLSEIKMLPYNRLRSEPTYAPDYKGPSPFQNPKKLKLEKE